jgi:hypothetical protein
METKMTIEVMLPVACVVYVKHDEYGLGEIVSVQNAYLFSTPSPRELTERMSESDFAQLDLPEGD